ncbi:MAG: 1,4-alpha-glucan-branching enzyme [Frankiales bacterium]|nr:1,4-alpha-glucan-branching enzyme [Frankiales bacterium]
MAWPRQPVVYEINTAVWLDGLSGSACPRRTLADVTSDEWDTVALDGVDAIWLMGVWERSPVGRVLALANGELLESFRDALPDVSDSDIIGSPYCVRRYQVDPELGGEAGLAAARAALSERGKRLVLDYVPNHVAPDHPWVTEHPDRFVLGGPDDLDRDPTAWLSVGNEVIAHGRDPFFPAWPDVVQLNAFSAATRLATAQTLSEIAQRCDGIRCDMAMLVTNDIFRSTWSAYAGPGPEAEFWPQIIGELRRQHPDVVLFAETYWDLEAELQQQGFDFCYDKRLYDRLLATDATAVRAHLGADLGYQSRLLRFLENHDEPRVASRISPEIERACAVSVATLPGAKLWHEGQFEGRKVRPPVFLRRRPDEPADVLLADWYRWLIALVEHRQLTSGSWRLLEVTGWPDNQSCRDVLAWAWVSSGPDGDARYVVLVNLSAHPAQGLLALPWPDLAGQVVRLDDLAGGPAYERSGDEFLAPGVYVALAPWDQQIFEVT